MLVFHSSVSSDVAIRQIDLKYPLRNLDKGTYALSYDTRYTSREKATLKRRRLGPGRLKRDIIIIKIIKIQLESENFGRSLKRGCR